MELTDFIRKWQASTRTERAASQEHFIDLCRLLKEQTPNEADPHGEFYAFEKSTEKTLGGDGFADVWFKDHFAWEYKGKKKNLGVAYKQLLLYREDLQNPPLLVVCDLNRFEVHTNFTGTAKRIYAFDLGDLASNTPTISCPIPPLDVLRRLFKQPSSLRPDQTVAQVTEQAAREFAIIAQRLHARGERPDATAHFLMRLLFCLFAEDAGLLPDKLFKTLVESRRRRPDDFARSLSQLFAAMATGGDFGVAMIPYFNGGLFADNTVLPLTTDDMETLLAACALDWSSVEPAIFGTLFERSLDPAKRAQLGAHYTSREDIDLIVLPVLIAPLRRRWEEVQTRARTLIAARPRTAGKVRTRQQRALKRPFSGFANEIASVRVLDPACGSGNFLYVSLKHLLDLEKEVITFAGANEVGSFLPSVNPAQLHGIEVNDYAFELAQVVIWIGYLQWLHDSGFGYDTNPVLKPIVTVHHMDAILTTHGDGTFGEPAWPEADVIVGNPPFLGGKRLKTELGDAYVEQLFKVWNGRVPREADLCCYWFEKARMKIADGRIKRAGLLATQGIRGGKNRVVLERIKQNGDIFYAQADRPWILDGAAVHISMVGFDNGSETRRLLNERTDGSAAEALANAVPVEGINANLTSRVDVTRASRLKENQGICFQGAVVVGAFDVDPATADRLLRSPNPDGRPNSEVVFPVTNAADITGRTRGWSIIDFGQRTAHEAALYEAPFEYVRQYVKPERDSNRDHQRREFWWRHGRSGGALKKALVGKYRQLASPRVAKHRLFVWVSVETVVTDAVVAFARDDDYTLGVLHSLLHEVWARATGTQLREEAGGFRYTPTTCFETFPFPEATPDQQQAVAAAAAELTRLRENWLNPPGMEGADLKSRTRTNLYNQPPTWLKNIHEQLDEAVFAAYGWPGTLNDEEILTRLLALNLSREPA